MAQNVNLKNEYVKFIDEYQKLGHMVRVFNEQDCKYYLPHQAVIREGSTTTKLRVVFDASAKTSNGRSLNDVMYTGPKLQRDIFDIILKWRLWKFVVTADVEKMFRQIKVHKEDQQYQNILWRNDSKKPLTVFRLNTVTYGTASAPFLAVRSLFKIAEDCNEELIKKLLRKIFIWMTS
uniref:Reverse transcriptase domain-containing protein n=1 Tax=Ceratitis capitata TaxID=7213 RepID=W8AT37_CERCA